MINMSLRGVERRGNLDICHGNSGFPGFSLKEREIAALRSQ